MPTYLFIIDSFGGGGVERCMSYIVRDLSEKGVRVVACAYLANAGMQAETQTFHDFPPGTILPPLLKVGRAFQLAWYAAPLLHVLAFLSAVIQLPRSRNDFSYLYRKNLQFIYRYYRSIRALKRVLEQERPDAVLTFRRNSALVALLAKFFYRLSVPVYCAHRDHVSRRIADKPNAPLFRLMARRFFRRANFHIAVSNGVKVDVIQNFDVPESRIATLYNGTDVEFLKRQSREKIQDDAVDRILSDPRQAKVVNIGRLSIMKGHDVLLRAFAKVLNVVDGHLFIAGTGEEKDNLQALARQLNISEKVHFLGSQKNPFVYLGRCDLYVSSSYSDGLSNALIEAMGLELPIIAADCDFGPRELLENGKFGLLVPVQDESALAEAMIRVLTNESLKKELKTLSKQRVQLFGVEKMLSKYEELLTTGRI